MLPKDGPLVRRPHVWVAAVLLAAAPFLIILFVTIWRTPMPVSEAVALFEDVQRRPPFSFFELDTSYYRPLYHLTLSAIWNSGVSLDSRLGAIKLLQIIPAAILVVLFVWHLRPRTALDAAAATFAVAVLAGSQAFRDNLEIPLSYTTVGMPIALGVWMLLNRPSARWHTPAIIALTLVAIGFKEQGLVIVPMVVAMWWTGAPGASRRAAAAVTAIAVAYVALRLRQSGSWPLFQQDVGFGFYRLSPDQALARFGAFPLWIFAYSGASTVGNVLFSEPTEGVFRIVRDISLGRAEPWEWIHLLSSGALTALIAWWGIACWRQSASEERSSMLRVFIVLTVVLAASGVLSFDYSRDRLGGMAVVFYAIAAFHAVRAIAAGAVLTPGVSRFLLTGVALVLLAAAWHVRAIGTIEMARVRSVRNSREWMVALPDRRAEFSERLVYLNIMERMVSQGTAPSAPRPTAYPHWVEQFFHEK